MTQIAVASDGKLKIGSCQREDVVGVTDADSSKGIHFTSSNKKGKGGFKAVVKRFLTTPQNTE